MLRTVLLASLRKTVKREITRKWHGQPNFHFVKNRKRFSSQSQHGVPENAVTKAKSPGPGSALPKIVFGSAAFGVAVYFVYQTVYLSEVVIKDQGNSYDLEDKSTERRLSNEHLGEKSISSSREELHNASPTHYPPQEESIVNQADGEGVRVEESSDLTPSGSNIPLQDDNILKSSQSSTTLDSQSMNSASISKDNTDTEGPEPKPTSQNHDIATSILDQGEKTTTSDPEERPATESLSETSNILKHEAISEHVAEGMQKDTSSKGLEADEYLPEQEPVSFGKSPKEGENKAVDVSDVYVSSDGKLVVDFLEAIHAAEKRQHELDSRIFAEEKRKLKEKYENELKDSRARELMYAEEAAILDKELDRARVKSEVTLKSFQEKAEEKLKMELKQKEHESSLKMGELQELAKAELVASISREKASHIEKMTDTNLHIDALQMAFYARSEEARRSHSVYKLTSSLLLLEDALTKGLPIEKEVEALIEKDPLLDSVLLSISREARKSGTNTSLHLNQKLRDLKSLLRPLSLVPPQGGGILTYGLAHIASWLKVQEGDRSGEGIESVINRVEAYLADGKLVEAADALEEGVRGSRASEVCGEWLRRARDRAIVEQALDLLRSYASLIDQTYSSS